MKCLSHKHLNLPDLLPSKSKTRFGDFFRIPGIKAGSFEESVGFVAVSLVGEQIFSFLNRITKKNTKKYFFSMEKVKVEILIERFRKRIINA